MALALLNAKLAISAYRARIAPLYNGLGHVLLNYLIGGAALWYCIQQIHRPTWVGPATSSKNRASLLLASAG